MSPGTLRSPRPVSAGGGFVVGFDLDQTLVDSSDRIVASFRVALAALGRPDVDASAFAPVFGYPLATILEHVSPGTDLDSFVPAYRRAYDIDHEAVTHPMPHAHEALSAVHRLGGRSVVVSAKHEPVVGVALAEAGLGDLVDDYRGDLFGHDKAPALRSFGADVYVGDHVADIDAGHGAGALVVAVSTGSHPPGALTAAGADAVIADLSALPSALALLGFGA